MLRNLLTRIARRAESFLGVKLPYMHFMIEHAPGALLPVMLSMPASGYGRHVPAPVLHMVRLGATQAEDCGECLQIAVNMAVGDGVERDHIAAAIAGRWQGVPDEYAEAFAFGRATASGHPEESARAAMQERYSERGVVEVSMAAATSLFYPALKRGLGFAQACEVTALDIGGAGGGGQ